MPQALAGSAHFLPPPPARTPPTWLRPGGGPFVARTLCVTVDDVDTFEYAMILKAPGAGTMTRGNIPEFGGQHDRSLPVDVLEHLQLVGAQGWELVSVESQPKQTFYWLRRRSS